MHGNWNDFDTEAFDFHRDPVLVLEGFWSDDETRRLRASMGGAGAWRALQEMPEISDMFRGAGNWGRAHIGDDDLALLRRRLLLPCVRRYVESFDGSGRRHLALEFFAYGAGDCLPIHDDADEAGTATDEWRVRLRRRIAVVTYVHPGWDPNWGGELILYGERRDARGNRSLVVTHCVPPLPGQVVMFTVPRFHRVARVDPYAGRNRRLSVAGWFMTEEDGRPGAS